MMHKFCHKCGSKLAVEDVFCEICGEKQVEVTEPVITTQPTQQEQPKKKKNRMIGLCVTAVAILLVITLLITIVNVNRAPYEKTIDNLFRIYYYGEYEKIEQMAPKAYWEWINEQGVTLEDIVGYYEKFHMEDDLWQDLKEEYGENVKVSYKIIYQTNLSPEQREGLSYVLTENYNIDSRGIGTMHKIVIVLEVDGTEDKDFELDEFTVVKINGKWYVVSYYGEILYYWTGNIY